jgi:predicted Zn-dependent protease
VFIKRNIFLTLLLLVSACATPQTRVPTATPEEIALEEQWQYEQSIKNPFPPIIEPVSRTEKMKKRLQKIANKVSPEATRICREMYPDDRKRNCNFSLEISKEKGVNAYADGNRVVITTAMMAFTNDTQLAFVLSHELAHNILGHVDSTAQNILVGALIGGAIDAAAGNQYDYRNDNFTQTGAHIGRLSYSPSFEHEADYLGLYILARAGYNIKKAPDFWRAMAQHNPSGIYSRTTHPTHPERFVVMKKTIKEIENKKRLKQPLLPQAVDSNMHY